MSTLQNRYRISQKDGDGEPEFALGLDERGALDALAKRAGHASYAAACAAAGLSVAAGLDRITVDLVQTAADYLGQMIDDDMALAKLLRYGDLTRPQPVDNYRLWGVDNGARGLEARMSSKPLPRWRRDPEAMGLLIERLPMCVERDDEAGIARVRIAADGMTVHATARYSEHPSIGHALRQAMVQAAIDFLTASKESRRA